jgi:hypothetical protein
MDDESIVEPLETRTVDFYGDMLVATLVPNEEQEDIQDQIFIPLRPLCASLGVSVQGQLRRVQADEVLGAALRPVNITLTGQGERTMQCLPLSLIPGFLFGLNPARAKQDVQEKITRYRRECFRVLYRAFADQALLARTLLAPTSSALAQVAQMGRAITALAEEQMALESRVNTTESRLDRAAIVVMDLGRRLSTVERRVSPGREITDEQAAELSARVKAVADAMARSQPGKNPYQSVFSELGRRYGVTSYKNLRIDQYESAMSWLADWLTAAGADSEQ